MDWRRSDDSAERFSAYLGELASVIGHVARVGPLRAYCWGLLLECERKSVEPIARRRPRTRPALGISRCCTFSPRASGPTRRCSARCASWCCRRSSGTDRSRPGSSTTLPSPNAGRTRSAYRTNIAASLASRPIARWPFRCRLPIMPRAFPSPIGFIFPRAGRATKSAARRPAFPRQLSFKPSRRSRFSRSNGRGRPVFPAALS